MSNRISDITKYETEKNYFKTAHRVVVTATADKDYLHGDVFPANGTTAKGIVLHDTAIDDPIAIVVEGHIYENRLPNVPVAAAKTALKNIAFYDETKEGE